MSSKPVRRYGDGHPVSPVAACSLVLASAFSLPTFAQVAPVHPVVLPEIKVVATPDDERNHSVAASDASVLLSEQPGYSVAAGGGVSGLPVANGMADDRLKVSIDGMEITSACGNHMNGPLSYIAPQQVGAIKLMAGITPVSVGGDNIGGTISVQSPAPVFARPGAGLHTEGLFTLGSRSVNDMLSAGLSGTIASDKLSIAYSGAYARAESYKDGNGAKVLASMFESRNQALTLAARGDSQLITLRVGEQRIPFQGFPNQYMDMTDNRAMFGNLAYTGEFSWGQLDARVYWQDTEHEMGFFTPEKTGRMPMNTRGRNFGYTVKAEIPLQGESKLRLGNEYHRFLLDDWWPPVAGSMMMGPNAYQNINGGSRDRMVFFAEWEGRLAPGWSGLFGVRDEIVRTDAGKVQPYGTGMMSMTDVMAANTFNARSHDRRDNNVDLTALLRFDADAVSTYEFGIARKTRSPNLYERYTWGRSSMAMSMTNWFGDGNGYVGDIDLKPEVAHTLSATADWHDAERKRWNVRVTPYYSHVNNYIDTDVVGTFNAYQIAGVSRNQLQFANHDAKLYGLNLSWQLPLADNTAWGDFRFRGNAAVTRGKRSDGGDLYRMMPFNMLLAVEQNKGAWQNVIEARLVTRKSRTDENRLEPETAGYALVNLRTRYQLSAKIALSAGISNLFDRYYADPMGGVYLSELKANGVGPLTALPGYGRSVDLGLSIGF